MQTFLFIVSDPSLFEKELEKLKAKFAIDQFSFHEFHPAPSIGIGDIREIKKILTLKSAGGGNRLVVIKEADKATPEAQNAMLKILEEPPASTYIVMTVVNPQTLLPTILSRSTIIRLQETGANTDKTRQTELWELLIKIGRASAGKRITLSQELAKSKEECLVLLSSLLTLLEKKLYLQTESPGFSRSEMAGMLTRIEAARKFLERNVNYKATLDILFLGFPKIPHPNPS